MLGGAKGDPQEIADVVLRTIETPPDSGSSGSAWKRSARHCGPEPALETVQGQILAAFGMTELTKLDPRSSGTD